MAEAPVHLLDAVASEVASKLGEAKSSLYNDAMGFIHAVDFSEPWFKALAAFHVAAWVTVVASRNNMNVQTVLFLIILAAVYASERLNHLGAEHWRAFAGQDYFDKHGVFISVLWSAPLLGDAFLIIIFALRTSAGLLVQVKRAELKQSRSARATAKASMSKND